MKTFCYVGSWSLTPGTAKGLTVYEYDEPSGRLKKLGTEGGQYNKGGTFLDEKRKILYIADESTGNPDFLAGGGGRIAAFRIDPESGMLTEICNGLSYGANPSYIAIDRESSYMLVANHGSRAFVTKTKTDADGNISIDVSFDESSLVLFRLNEDGTFEKPCDIFRFAGHGDKPYQTGPHAHCVVGSPDGNFYAVCDKGADNLYLFRLDREKGKIIPCQGSPIKRSRASAPRYCIFHREEPYLFINKEYRSIVSSFKYNEDGALEFISSENALPEGIDEPTGAGQSDICIDASGKYIYELIRGVNAISVFEAGNSGRLKRIQTVLDACISGRGCKISPDGRFLVASENKADRVSSYPIGPDGKIGPAVEAASQNMAATIDFIRL